MTAAIALIAALSFVGGACLTYYVVTRPHDQADALDALRRVWEAVYDYGDPVLFDLVDDEVADLDLYDDDYTEAAS